MPMRLTRPRLDLLMRNEIHAHAIALARAFEFMEPFPEIEQRCVDFGFDQFRLFDAGLPLERFEYLTQRCAVALGYSEGEVVFGKFKEAAGCGFVKFARSPMP